jgi:hypothetical protein
VSTVARKAAHHGRVDVDQAAASAPASFSARPPLRSVNSARNNNRARSDVGQGVGRIGEIGGQNGPETAVLVQR